VNNVRVVYLPFTDNPLGDIAGEVMQKSRDPRETAPHTKAYRQLRVMFTYYLLLSVMMSFVIRKKKRAWGSPGHNNQDITRMP